GYFCADVSGHDLGSSLATSAFKALIHQNAGLLYTPDETFRIVNSVLTTVLGESVYLTAVYALVNRRKKEIQIVSAGHPPVIFFPLDGKPYQIESAGDVLGIFDNVVLEIKKIKVKKGDRLFLYTDCIIEEDGSKQISRAVGIQRLIDHIEKTKEKSIDDAVNNIILNFLKPGTSPEDDILLMGVEI
nr:PP2C family protein-serine/threonine phosphatase [Spirochaetia bacterium]